MQQEESEHGETTAYDVLDIPLSKPLSSNEDCQIQRIRKSLIILNGLVLVSYFYLIKYPHNSLFRLIYGKLLMKKYYIVV